MADDTETLDPAAGFAKLMGQAKEAAEQTRTEDAPYGYTTDADGTVRPKKTAGRPRKSPSLDELKAQRAEAAPPDGGEAASAGDRAPDEKATRGRRAPKNEDEKKSYPQFREGVIEKGINRLYRKAGKLVKVVSPVVGQALIDITRAEDEDDITVGKAWEEVARTNPRIRAFLLKIIKGGAWGQLLMAHAPVLLAALMQTGLLEKLPLGGLVEAFLTPDEKDGEAPADGTVFGGLNLGDAGVMQDLMGQAQEMAAQIVARQASGNGRAPNAPRTPEAVLLDTKPADPELDPFAMAVAAKAASNGQPPPAFARNQPKRSTRAQRAR